MGIPRHLRGKQPRYSGSCHCENIRVALYTNLEQLPLRECQCSFCRMHGSVNTSDPQGFADITVRDSSRFRRYRFGNRTADFFLCTECGGYPAAVMDDAFATVNVNVLQLQHHVHDSTGAVGCGGGKTEADDEKQPDPVSYESETPEERLARRRQRWTPAAVTILHS